MANYNLTKMAVNMYCPGNVVQMDDAGLPSLLVYIPAFRLCDVLNTTDESIHPAFIVNGVQIPGFYYSKYENVVYNGKAYSLPGEVSKGNITFDTARECCEAKGHGWHLSTAAEWAAIALWSKKNGTLPYGNNNYGKDHNESEYKAIPMGQEATGPTNKVATGTGPLTWSHDGTASGIWDMNGNVNELQAGFRLVYGELQLLANNDAADCDNSLASNSVCWKAINAADGSLVTPENSVDAASGKSSGNTIRVKYDESASVCSYSTETGDSTINSARVFYLYTCDASICEKAKLLLRALALLPEEGDSSVKDDYINLGNSRAEVYLARGGMYSNAKGAGIFRADGITNSESSKYSIGFRAAYIPNI